MAAPHWGYETPQPWEKRQGALVDRVVCVSVEAQRIYAQQEALLPTIHHDHAVDPAIGDHLADVGKRIQILQENARKPDKKALAIAHKHDAHKRVVPSRFPEHDDSGDEGEEDDDDQDDTAFIQGRIETMLMDQEWDTRSWNKAKIQIAVETLYEQVEHSDDHHRRALATTMLIRLLETHESAVEYVESTIPILMNKAFRSLSKIVDKPRMFRVSTLVSVLAEWFAPILSRDNAIAKSMAFLLRESELCARIVQHHWRGVVFERSLATRLDIDPSVRTRLRSMHFIKNVELRHQFKVLRDVVGPSGLPVEALRAYVKILFHLVKPTPTAVDKNRHHVATGDQTRLLGSGILVVLASLIPNDVAQITLDQRDACRAITEHVKGIALELTECFRHEADKIIEILKSNIIERVIGDLNQQLQPASRATAGGTAPVVSSSLRVVAAAAKAVWQLYHTHKDDENTHGSSSSVSYNTAAATEASFSMRRLETTTRQLLTTPHVMETLLCVLPLARQWLDSQIAELVLATLRFLSGSFGFKPLLDALTRNGGRALEQIVFCFDWESSPLVVRAAVALFHDMTSRADARAGFTTAGAVGMLAKWCDTDIGTAKNPSRFVLALCGLALLARQYAARKAASPAGASAGNLLGSLASLETRLEAFYAILLALVSGSSNDTREAALYLHHTAGVFQPILLRFLVHVTPSDMAPAFQTRHQRSISCIVLARFCKVPAVAAAAFSETTVVHIALSLQCNRLDELEGKLRRSHSKDYERRFHYLGLQEACKALSRLARCPSSPTVDVSLRPSITSGNVPLLPQAIICDVLARLHVLEDILPLIHVPTDAAEFPEIDRAMVHAAIELVGYLRPMPYGETTRQHFLQATATHPHGTFAYEKLAMLVAIGAPMILHVLKEKTCGSALVSTCCTALSRLAATNHCRSLLLKQGALFIALTHLPEVLYDREASKKHQRAGGSPMRFGANVDDLGLLDVPASLFTLLGKLCAIADGRTAMMKAQVLPRVLKRLQLTATTPQLKDDNDLDVKCEIAVLIRRLAMCNAVEGNTSELFLHFHVIELLAAIIIDHTQALPSASSPVKKTRAFAACQRQWRVLDNVAGAIAALAQDVLVCVPKIVQLDILSRLTPLLFAGEAAAGDNPQPAHVASLQYHIVNIARAIATYPFGEFHGYLLRVGGTVVNGGVLPTATGPATFLDRVKKIAYDFTLELQGGVPVGTDEQKTIGELAREILGLLRERERSGQRPQPQVKRATLSTAVSPSRSRPSSPQAVSGPHPGNTSSRGISTPARREKLPDDELVALPALSPKRESLSPHLSSGRSETPPQARAVLVPLGSPPTTSAGSLPLGLDLLSTRPPPKPTVEAPYTFARPKDKQRKHKERRKRTGLDESEQFLMLDPLFQNNSPQTIPRRRHADTTSDPVDEEGGFVYLREIAHEDHQVNLHDEVARATSTFRR